MPILEEIFTPSPSYSIITVGLAFVAGIVVGILVKNGVIAKGKKRVLHLEDEMLSNHSKILSLEKQLADLRKETKDRREDEEKNTTVGLRAS